MATTPYVRIPYASERDRYTGRAYTAQQLALMDRQSARESAYARDRAQRMSDRWSGFGGLVTETLGDLRQSREVREAQALEQARHDEEQARLKRIEDENNRRFGVEEDWRKSKAQRDEDRIAYENTLRQDPSIPFTENQIRVTQIFDPGSLRRDPDLTGPRAFGDPATATPPPRDGTTVSLGPEVFGSAPAQMGERAFGGLFPATSGGETLAGVARGTRDRETGVDLGIAPDERFFAPTPVAPERQSYRQLTAVEARLEEEVARNEDRYQGSEDARIAALGVAEDARIENVRRYNESIAHRGRVRGEDVEFREGQAGTPLPAEVNAALATLAAKRLEGVTRDQAIADIHANWDRWSATYPDLKLEDVQAVVVDMWPRPGAGSQWDNLNLSGGVFEGGGLPGGIAPPLTAQPQDDLGTAAVLVEQGFFATIPEALQSIRESEDPEVPVPEVPPAPPAAPPPRGADLEAAQRAREAAGLSPLTTSQQAGFPSPAARAEAGAARAEEQAAQRAERQATQGELQRISASEPPYPMPTAGLRTADVAPVYRALRAAHAEGGLEGLLGYVLENRASLQRSRFDVERYIQRIQARIDSD